MADKIFQSSALLESEETIATLSPIHEESELQSKNTEQDNELQNSALLESGLTTATLCPSHEESELHSKNTEQDNELHVSQQEDKLDPNTLVTSPIESTTASNLISPALVHSFQVEGWVFDAIRAIAHSNSGSITRDKLVEYQRARLFIYPYPIDPVYDHIYRYYTPNFTPYQEETPFLSEQTQNLGLTTRSTWKAGFNSRLFSLTWRTTGVPQVAQYSITGTHQQKREWIRSQIFQVMEEARNSILELRNRAVEAQNNPFSPAFFEDIKEYFNESHCVRIERSTALVEFLSEPMVHHFLVHLVLNRHLERVVRKDDDILPALRGMSWRISGGSPAKEWQPVQENGPDGATNAPISVGSTIGNPEEAGGPRRPSVLTSDGRDAYDVLGDQYPPAPTLADHPHVNKFMRADYTFLCAYCKKETSESYDWEASVFCCGCGPCSSVRYCQKSCLLADSMDHRAICGQQHGNYPLLWPHLPLHYYEKYPYIKPLGGQISPQCFRQMAYAAVVTLDGVIENPFRAYYRTKMAVADREKCKEYVETEYAFVDSGDYYIFTGNSMTGGTVIELTVEMNPWDKHFFRRARNAAILTGEMPLIELVYRMVKRTIHTISSSTHRHNGLENFERQFREEFPTFNGREASMGREDQNNVSEAFQREWMAVEPLVRDLELKHPILRAWMTDEDPDALPSDPVKRYEGLQWLRHDPWEEKFIEGELCEWGLGWNGQVEEKWGPVLDKMHRRWVGDALKAMNIK